MCVFAGAQTRNAWKALRRKKWEHIPPGVEGGGAKGLLEVLRTPLKIDNAPTEGNFLQKRSLGVRETGIGKCEKL
jgi:hypothetical protein